MLYTNNSNFSSGSAHAATTQFAMMTLMVIAGYLAMTSGAFAGGDALGDALCKIVQLAMGKAGRGIATLAVIILGIGATLGKVSWGMAMIVTVGIAVLFNAEDLANLVSGSNAKC